MTGTLQATTIRQTLDAHNITTEPTVRQTLDAMAITLASRQATIDRIDMTQAERLFVAWCDAYDRKPSQASYTVIARILADCTPNPIARIDLLWNSGYARLHAMQTHPTATREITRPQARVDTVRNQYSMFMFTLDLPNPAHPEITSRVSYPVHTADLDEYLN